MTTQTRNEAAARLRVQVQAMTDTLEAYASGRLGWDGFQETIGAAFAAERRATVERIEQAVKVVAENERYDLQYSREVTRLARDVRSHLDEEAAR